MTKFEKVMELDTSFVLEGVARFRVNAFNPGGMRTSMRASAFPGEDPDTLPRPEDVAPSVVWLLSPASAPHNGQSLDVR